MDSSVVGCLGRVVTRVRGGAQPGEVRIVVRGLPHEYLAYAAAPIPVGTDVLVIASRGARQVDVEPWDQPGLSLADAPDQPRR